MTTPSSNESLVVNCAVKTDSIIPRPSSGRGIMPLVLETPVSLLFHHFGQQRFHGRQLEELLTNHVCVNETAR